MAASSSALLLRRLTLQQAPIADVVPHAKSLSQSEIVQQLGIGTRDWAALPLAYRQRLLKQILARLTARSMLAAGGDVLMGLSFPPQYRWLLERTLLSKLNSFASELAVGCYGALTPNLIRSVD